MADIDAPARAFLRAHLADDFVFHEGWRGAHKHAGEPVAYDLVLEPNPHLVARGFATGFVVVEVKVFQQSDKAKHEVKVRDLLWQCLAHSYSAIILQDGARATPLFSLYYIDGDGIDPAHAAEANLYHHFVQRGGVGKLVMKSQDDWAMQFGPYAYSTKKGGRTKHGRWSQAAVGVVEIAVAAQQTTRGLTTLPPTSCWPLWRPKSCFHDWRLRRTSHPQQPPKPCCRW